jgi:hypothetical protein
MNFLILCAPCNGFGDVVFAMKLGWYLQKWFNLKSLKIATTVPEHFQQLGENPKNLILLRSKKEKYKQCRRFANMKAFDLNKNKVNLNYFDFYFLAPLQSDLDFNYYDIKKLIPKITREKLLSFSEYNDSINKKVDFHTGIGNGRYGLLMVEMYNIPKPKIKNPFFVCYISDKCYFKGCIFNFIKMISKKYYKKLKTIEVLVTEESFQQIEDNLLLLTKIIKRYYKNIVLQDKEDKENSLIIRKYFPVKYNEMLGLIKYSQKDILLTGDQSITDALMISKKAKYSKNIFYQVCSWKKNFAVNLSNHLPHKYLSTIKKACGDTSAINYKMNFSKFIKKWDFEKLAKKKITERILNV